MQLHSHQNSSHINYCASSISILTTTKSEAKSLLVQTKNYFRKSISDGPTNNNFFAYYIQEPTIPTLSNAIKVVNQTQNNARQLP